MKVKKKTVSFVKVCFINQKVAELYRAAYFPQPFMAKSVTEGAMCSVPHPQFSLQLSPYVHSGGSCKLLPPFSLAQIKRKKRKWKNSSAHK